MLLSPTFAKAERKPLLPWFIADNEGKIVAAHCNSMACLEEWMLKPLSAKVVSPGRRLSKRSQCSVICLSLTFPPQPSEMKLTKPCGVTPLGV